jgi:hypothetical protein
MNMKTLTEPTTEDATQAGVTKEQFARRWNVSKRQTDSWLRAGLPHMRLSYKLLRIIPAEGDAWLKARFSTARIGPANGAHRD